MLHKDLSGDLPPGIKLRHTLQAHDGPINLLSWSRDGRTIASPSDDGTVRLWDAETGKLLRTLTGHTKPVITVAWSPDMRTLASGSHDETILLWDAESGAVLKRFNEEGAGAIYSAQWSPDGSLLAFSSAKGSIQLLEVNTGARHKLLVDDINFTTCLAWSPDGSTLASGSSATKNSTITLWNPESKKVRRTLSGHEGAIYSLAWSPDGRRLASGSHDKTIRIWKPANGQLKNLLEGPTSDIYSVAFSFDGRLLASKSGDKLVRLWRCDTWAVVAAYEEPSYLFAGLSFHPHAHALATQGNEQKVVRVWDLNLTKLLSAPPPGLSGQYVNAKIILVGDSGVGKSGLALRLTGRAFAATESTHGRHVWVMYHDIVDLGDGRTETRETLLWDMAGQPGYRLIHQLHLNETAVALVVFDSRGEVDPLSGIAYWNRALCQAQALQGDSGFRMRKFLVAARVDRGGVPLSSSRVESVMSELGFDQYFETSAREGWQIEELAQACREAIDWQGLPKVISTRLLQTMKDFLLREKMAGRLLMRVNDLYSSFLDSEEFYSDGADLRAQFETCIGRLESRDLLRRLSFGGFILLQPEMLDSYASAIVQAAKNQPDGMGYVVEDELLRGRLPISDDERIPDREMEKLLLIATFEDLVRHELAFRETTEREQLLIFPSQVTRQHSEPFEPDSYDVVFNFEGAVQNIYATLVIRLARGGVFKMQEMWSDTATFTDPNGGVGGVTLRQQEEGLGELLIFFSREAEERYRALFDEYVLAHLRNRAMRGSVRRRRVFVCPECRTPVSPMQADRRRERGFDWIVCNVCETRVSLIDRTPDSPEARLPDLSVMDRAADEAREQAVSAFSLAGKVAVDDYDVLLFHDPADREEVEEVAAALRTYGVLPWVGPSRAADNAKVYRELAEQIGATKSVAVFVGRGEHALWQQKEVGELLQSLSRRRRVSVIPVCLKSCSKRPKLPRYIERQRWIDFRQPHAADALSSLIAEITGFKPIDNNYWSKGLALAERDDDL